MMKTRNYTIISAAYLRWLLAAALSTLLLIVAINRLIDPFGQYERPRIDGLNANKPAFATHLRLGKAEAVRHIRPSVIALGTSRAEFGIDPNHPGWRAKPVYNLALSGSNIYENYRYLMHAHAIHPLSEAVLSLNFHMFNVTHHEPPDFDERRLAISEKGVLQDNGWADDVTARASLDALYASIETARKQHEADQYLGNGMSEPTYNAAAEIEKQGGHRAAFQSNEKGYFTGIYKNFAFANKQRDMPEQFRRLLDFAHQNQIGLRIYIHPSHARQFETKAAAGLWPLFEEWKRMLLRINAEEARRAGKPAFPLWDFSGYNSLTTEPVPPLGDTQTQMRWYWESSHYKPALGDLVLDRVFGHQEPGRHLPADFGVLLTPKTIEPHLAQIRADRQRWRAAFPADVAEIERLMKSRP